MTKTFAAVQNPRADQPSQPPINSIMATVTTARDLDIAHRQGQRLPALLEPEPER